MSEASSARPSERTNPDPSTPATPEKKSSPVRLIVLLSILAVLFAAWMYDMFVMYDQVKVAGKRLAAAHDAKSARGVDTSSSDNFMKTAEVQESIGFAPTRSQVKDGVLVEEYRWWGALPLQRRYIRVKYKDKDGNEYDDFEVFNASMFGGDDDADQAPAILPQGGAGDPAETPPGVGAPSGPTTGSTPTTGESTGGTPSPASPDADTSNSGSSSANDE